MSYPIRGIKLIAVVGVGAALVGLMLWLTLRREAPAGIQTSNQNQNIDVVRQQYGDLYQAAWRQDEGRGNVLMTATLFVPPLIDLLGRDRGKSEAENQLHRALKDTTSSQVAIFLTIDSVGGAQTDQAIRDSLELSADDQALNLVSWQPLIFPSRIVNTSAPATSQTSVVIFAADQGINWSWLNNLRLDSKNMGGIPRRSFIWTKPGLLLEAQ